MSPSPDHDSMEPFEVSVDDDVIADLDHRISQTRWPDQLPDAGWDYGTDRAFLQDVLTYWQDEYDWDAFRGRANAYDQYTTTIDGQRLHFYHVRSGAADAEPLLMLHGWPSTSLEFLAVADRLSEPDDGEQAFDLVVPSLPGYGFSGPTQEQGYDVARMSADFLTLMERLGYDRFLAVGEDWGGWICTYMAATHPERLTGIYPLKLFANPDTLEDPEGMLTEADRATREETRAFWESEAGYHTIQSTKPQTLAYGLNDSPAGLAGWILEKWRTWTDCDGRPDDWIDRDRLLDTVSVYWLTGTINSSTRLYYEMDETGRDSLTPASVDVPTGHARYPAGVAKVPRSWAEAVYDVVHWSDMERGGHFPALEVPDLFVRDLRAFVRTVE